MPKIKDLAVIAVDNAFTLFPVDSERYELLSALDCFLACPGDYRDDQKVLQTSDERINRWVFMTDESLTLGALSYRAVIDLPKAKLSSLTRDRARRCKATLQFWVDDVRWQRVWIACPDVLNAYLWGAVVRCFSLADAGHAMPPRLCLDWLDGWQQRVC